MAVAALAGYVVFAYLPNSSLASDSQVSASEARNWRANVPPKEVGPELLGASKKNDTPAIASVRAFVSNGKAIGWRSTPTALSPQAIRDFEIIEMIRLAKEERDSHTAGIVARYKNQCERAPADLESLEREKEALLQSRIVSTTLEGGDQVGSDEHIALTIIAMDDVYEKCKSLREALACVYTDFWELGIRNGHAGIMVEYAQNIEKQNPETARAYYEEAWRMGHPEALRMLSRMEQRRYENDHESESRMNAMALRRAYVSIRESQMENFGLSKSHPAVQELVEPALTELNGLLESERGVALQRAGEIIAGNPNCCLQ